jgi:hypothetical protein
VLGTLLTKLVSENRTNWDEHLFIVLFSYKTTYKVATRYAPYQLMYGLHPLMAIEYIIQLLVEMKETILQCKFLTSKIIKLEKLQKNEM